MSPLLQHHPIPEGSPVFDRRAKLAFIVACVTLVVGGIGFAAAVNTLNYYLKKEPVAMRRPFSSVPKTLPGWQAVGDDRTLDEAYIEALGTDEFLTRSYARTEGDDAVVVTVHLTYYTGMIDTVPHVPDRCYVAAGLEVTEMPVNYEVPLDRSAWRLDPDRINKAEGTPYPILDYRDRVTFRRSAVRMPIGDFRLRTTEFQQAEQPDEHIFAGYMFIANGRTAATPESVKKLAFDLTDRFAYYTKVEFSMSGAGAFGAEQFLEEVADLLDVLLPEVMLCLPDWSEVEGQTESSA